MTHDFTGKSIKCETWEQMLHLGKIAKKQLYRPISFSICDFNNGAIYFETGDTIFLNTGHIGGVVTAYYDFIKTLPTEVVEVTGCDGCPFAFTELEFALCLHPKSEIPPHTDRFDVCPLKKASITIKLKQNEPTGN